MTYQPIIPSNLHLVAPSGQTPVYRHDCDGCHFLGQNTNQDGGIVDLYVHAYDHGPTVIARLSNEGSDYQAGYQSSFGMSPLLTEARNRAERLELIAYDVYSALEYAPAGSPDALRVVTEVKHLPEYKAYLAHLDGDTALRDSLQSQIVDARLARQRQHTSGYRRIDALMAAECILARVISAGAEISLFDAMRAVAKMSDSEWETALSEPEPEPDLDDGRIKQPGRLTAA